MIVAVAALADVAVLVLTTDKRLIDLDNTTQLRLGLNEGRPDLVAHAPSGFVRAEAHDALDLSGANALLAGEHHVDDAEPLAKRLVGVLEDRAGKVREAVAPIRRTRIALPLERHCLNRMRHQRTATRATDYVAPATCYQVRRASVFVGKHRLELRDGHLVNGLRTTGHDNLPAYRRHIGWISPPVKSRIIANFSLFLNTSLTLAVPLFPSLPALLRHSGAGRNPWAAARLHGRCCLDPGRSLPPT